MTAVFDAMHDDEQTMRQKNPGRANQMLTILGRLSLDMNLPQRAQGYLEELRAATPNSDAAHYSLGLAYVATGNAPGAKQEFEIVLQIAKKSSNYVLREPFAHFQLGLLALEEQPPNAAAALKELKDAKRTYRWEYMPNLFKFLAVAEELRGNRAAAKVDLDKELFLLGIDTGVSTPEQAPR
jgi:tetratricopeptide (TPR) repeat protein